MEKKTIRFHLIFWIGTVLLLALDRWSKHMALLHLKGHPKFVIIQDVFCLQYLENRGAAFGILQGKKVFFVVTTILFLFVICWVYHGLSAKKRFYPAYLVMSLLTAGAVGNFIDRIFWNYVVDFFYFELINFPVFNVADIYVTCGAALFIFFFLIYYKEEDITEMERQIFPWKRKG